MQEELIREEEEEEEEENLKILTREEWSQTKSSWRNKEVIAL